MSHPLNIIPLSLPFSFLGENLQKRSLNSAELRRYQARWRLSNDQINRLRQGDSIIPRWKQLNALVSMASVLSLDDRREERSSDAVRQRWNELQPRHLNLG